VQREKSEKKDPGYDVSAFFVGEAVRPKLRNIHTSTHWYGGPGMGGILLSLPLLSFIIVNFMLDVLETEFLKTFGVLWLIKQPLKPVSSS
jgi:hypothetical protein